MFRQFLRMGVLSGVLVGLIGCSGAGGKGPKLFPVKGKVTYKNQPLAGATVQLISRPVQGKQGSGGQLATGITNDQGEYTLSTGNRPGAVEGKHQVSITKFAQSQVSAKSLTPDDMKKMQMEMQKGGKAAYTPKSEIPEKFGNPQTSGLEKTVDASKNVFDFDLGS